MLRIPSLLKLNSFVSSFRVKNQERNFNHCSRGCVPLVADPGRRPLAAALSLTRLDSMSLPALGKGWVCNLEKPVCCLFDQASILAL